MKTACLAAVAAILALAFGVAAPQATELPNGIQGRVVAGPSRLPGKPVPPPPSSRRGHGVHRYHHHHRPRHHPRGPIVVPGIVVLPHH